MNAEMLAYLQGELLATQHALRAVITHSPDPVALRRLVAKQMEQVIAGSLASTNASDDLLAGIESAKRAVLPTDRDIARAAQPSLQGSGPAARPPHSSGV